MESKNRYKEEFWYRFLWLPSAAISRTFFNFKIIGKENLPKESAILVANHCTPMDGLLLSSIIFNQIHFFIQYEGIHDTITGWILEKGGGIFVKEEGINKEAINKSKYVLTKTNDYIGIFPEGPMKDLDKLDTPYDGAAYLSFLTNKDIIPMGIFVPEKQRQLLEERLCFSNLDPSGFLNDYNKINKRKKIPWCLKIGKPVNGSIAKSENKKRNRKELTDYLSNDCNRLAEEARIAYENRNIYK